MDFAARRDQLQERLQEENIDAAVACPGPNLQYFTGFRGELVDRFHALLIPDTGDSTLISPAGYLTQARAYAEIDAFQAIDGNDPVAVVAAIKSLLPSNPNTIVLDGYGLHKLANPFYEQFESGVILSADSLFQSLRRRKDDAELQALRRSAATADAVSENIRSLGADAIGLTEAEIATEIRAGLHTHGATGVSFDVVVGAGPNGAEPALRHSDRQIAVGEPVVVDFGCFFDGYASDQTRTVVFDGSPPDNFEAAHEAVLNALQAGVAAAQPGMTAGELDAIVRDTIDDHGFGDHFTHGTGHGVGLASHEALAIDAGESTELEQGMVFSIEPGVYFENEWGVRIEDLVALTDSGAERLNDSPRTWRPL